MSTRTYVVLAPHYWGKGETVEEAKKNLKDAGGKLTTHVVYLMPEGAEDVIVDGLGRLQWMWAEGDNSRPMPEVVSSRGWKST